MKKLTKATVKEIANIGYQDFIHNDKSDKEVKEALKDIVTRYGRKGSMGGYSADTIVDFLYIYFYEIHCKFRNFYGEGLEDLLNRINELEKEVKKLKKRLEVKNGKIRTKTKVWDT